VTEGLEQEFNSLDAQREAAEAFIASQRHEGWVCLPDRYDDGGFTGGNTDRPALRKLLADVEAGHIDCIVVYKVDRLSRSLLDFAVIMGALEKKNCAFVSVTQQFNTSHSMGRLTLNILLSFAQFEREIIAERTRDKIHSARRRGKWTGGAQILGYDVDPKGRRIVVNELEAQQVRELFERYLQIGTITGTAAWAQRQGIGMKAYITREGHKRGGAPFTKSTLRALLTNVYYRGKIPLRGEIFEGEHEAIVEEALWQKVQDRLAANRSEHGRVKRNTRGALLRGILFTAPDNFPMYHVFSTRGNKVYRYYVHRDILKSGSTRSATRTVCAGDIEAAVVERIRALGTHRELSELVLTQLDALQAEKDKELASRIEEGQKRAARLDRELVALSGKTGPEVERRAAGLLEAARKERDNLRRLREERESRRKTMIDRQSALRSLATFDDVWRALTVPEQEELIRLVLERVTYDATTNEVGLEFRHTGVEEFLKRCA
jgi:site-specific DNA recombinase